MRRRRLATPRFRGSPNVAGQTATGAKRIVGAGLRPALRSLICNHDDDAAPEILCGFQKEQDHQKVRDGS